MLPFFVFLCVFAATLPFATSYITIIYYRSSEPMKRRMLGELWASSLIMWWQRCSVAFDKNKIQPACTGRLTQQGRGCGRGEGGGLMWSVLKWSGAAHYHSQSYDYWGGASSHGGRIHLFSPEKLILNIHPDHGCSIFCIFFCPIGYQPLCFVTSM